MQFVSFSSSGERRRQKFKFRTSFDNSTCRNYLISNSYFQGSVIDHIFVALCEENEKIMRSSTDCNGAVENRDSTRSEFFFHRFCSTGSLATMKAMVFGFLLCDYPLLQCTRIDRLVSSFKSIRFLAFSNGSKLRYWRVLIPRGLTGLCNI